MASRKKRRKTPDMRTSSAIEGTSMVLEQNPFIKGRDGIDAVTGLKTFLYGGDKKRYM